MLRDVNGNGRFEENEVFTYTKDHLGSVKDITDVNAELKQRYGYTAYSITKLEKDDSHSSNKIIENPYAYTSREWEQETGCYYYRARWYCPQMQIFTSEDPIGFGGDSATLYEYVGRNPILYSDAIGLKKFPSDQGASTPMQRCLSMIMNATLNSCPDERAKLQANVICTMGMCGAFAAGSKTGVRGFMGCSRLIGPPISGPAAGDLQGCINRELDKVKETSSCKQAGDGN